MSDSNGLIAGWYADPAGTDALRWWDGANWTQQRRPNQPPPAAPVPTFAITASATQYPEVPEHAYAPAAPQGPAPTEPAASGPTRSAKTAGIWLLARSVALRRDRGKTWPAGVVLGIRLGALAAIVAIMISVVLAVLAGLGLLPTAGETDGEIRFHDPANDPRVVYGTGHIPEQKTILGPLPESSDPLPVRVENLIEAWYEFPPDGSGGNVDCAVAPGFVGLGSTFPCQLVDLDTADGLDSTGDLSVTLFADGFASFSNLGAGHGSSDWVRATIYAGKLPDTNETLGVRAAAVVAAALGFDRDPPGGTLNCSEPVLAAHGSKIMCEVIDLDSSDGTLPHRLSISVGAYDSVFYSLRKDSL